MTRLVLLTLAVATLTACDRFQSLVEPNYCPSAQLVWRRDTAGPVLSERFGRVDTVAWLLWAPKHVCLR